MQTQTRFFQRFTDIMDESISIMQNHLLEMSWFMTCNISELKIKIIIIKSCTKCSTIINKSQSSFISSFHTIKIKHTCEFSGWVLLKP